jgi:hypothetical protein
MAAATSARSAPRFSASSSASAAEPLHLETEGLCDGSVQRYLPRPFSPRLSRNSAAVGVWADIGRSSLG